MMHHLLCFLSLLSTIWASASTNNANIIWYDSKGNAQLYKAQEPSPPGFNETYKIVVNQTLPILWEVKFQFFNNLQDLRIENCGVERVEVGSFKELKPLTNLSLASNHIRLIQEGVFNGIEVKSLDLGHNKIQTITPRAFGDMPILEELILDYNDLKHWNGDWFWNCQNLKSVCISHNFLEELPPHLFKNFQAEKLSFYFSNNRISSVDRQALKATHFQDLFLDGNDLSKIDSHTFGKVLSVHNLNLTGNFLQCLSDEFINNVLNKVKVVSVVENPFKCHCIKELKKGEKKFGVEVHVSKNADCDLS